MEGVTNQAALELSLLESNVVVTYYGRKNKRSLGMSCTQTLHTVAENFSHIIPS